MDDREARALIRELVRRSGSMDPSQYLPQEPTDKQQAFLESQAFEALFGGAAGGGKSSALLIGAIRHACAGASVLVVRRTYADLVLPGAIMARSLEWLDGTDASWRAQDKKWEFPSGGVLQFGYLDTERDKYRYQGAEFQAVFVDELTQFTESQYTYLLSRIRRNTSASHALIARSASNPGRCGS